MRTPVSALLAGAFALLAAACNAQNEQPEAPESVEDLATTEETVPSDEGPTIEDMRDEALAEIDQEACREGGGEVRPEGMLGMPRCVTPYADAGEQCRDGSDCEGRCLGDDAVTDYEAPAGEQLGLCEANDSPFGCFAEINNGTAEAFLCVD